MADTMTDNVSTLIVYKCQFGLSGFITLNLFLEEIKYWKFSLKTDIFNIGNLSGSKMRKKAKTIKVRSVIRETSTQSMRILTAQ